MLAWNERLKKWIYRKPKNSDAPGASPRRYGAPDAIVLYDRDRVLDNTENRMRPRPQWGQGWREGVDDCKSRRSGAKLILYLFFALIMDNGSHQSFSEHSVSPVLTTAAR